MIFVIKRLLKLGNLAQKVPTLQFESFMVVFVTIIQVFKGGKLFKWGNYSKEETIQGRKLLLIRKICPRKLFKGGKYSSEETI